MTKYKNKKVELDGITFDSKREAQYYSQLLLLQKAGKVSDIECHPRYDINVNGRRIGFYKADFRFMDLEQSRQRVVDVKSKATVTAVFRLKAKLVEALYPGTEIEVVF